MAQPPLWPKLKVHPLWELCIPPSCYIWALIAVGTSEVGTICVLSGSHSISYKATSRWLLLVPWRAQGVNQGWLLLVPGLGQLNERYRAHWIQMLLVWENLGKSEAYAGISHLYGKATGNSLGGPESWVGHSLWESPEWGKQCEPGWWNLSYCTCLPTLWLWGEDSEKEQWPLPALLSGRKLSPSSRCDAGQLSSSLYVSDAFQSAAPMLELRGRSPGKSVCRPFKRSCLRLQQFLSSTASILAGFYCHKLWDFLGL